MRLEVQKMRRTVLTVLLACFAIAGAQEYMTEGVNSEVDEFTGAEWCGQGVGRMSTADHPEPLFLLASIGDAGGPVLSFARAGLDVDEVLFNMYGTLDGDAVLIRFPSTGEVVTFTPLRAGADVSGGMWNEFVEVPTTEEFMQRLFSANEDLRVRLQGPDGYVDEDLFASHLAEFQPFIEECL